MGRALVGALILFAGIALPCEWDYPIWIPRSATADPLYRFISNGRAGYINRKGEVVIQPSIRTYGNYGGEFENGLLPSFGRGCGYLDAKGKQVFFRDLEYCLAFSEGLAEAASKGGRLSGFIDTSGKFVIPPRFESHPKGFVSSFSNGFARIQVGKLYGYIDRTGEFVIPPQFADAEDFHDDRARVVLEDSCFHWTEGPCSSPRLIGEQSVASGPCKFTYIDRTGRVITTARFTAAREFSEGLAPVRLQGKWGFIDKNGLVAIEPKFDAAWPFHSGLARIQKGAFHGFASTSGEVVVELRYAQAEDFSEGLAVVSDDRVSFHYIDESGNRAIRGDFAAASPFFKGLAHVEYRQNPDGPRERRFAYIDAKGRPVFSYKVQLPSGY